MRTVDDLLESKRKKEPRVTGIIRRLIVKLVLTSLQDRWYSTGYETDLTYRQRRAMCETEIGMF